MCLATRRGVPPWPPFLPPATPMTNPAFNLNEDGSAVDPAAFRAALKADSGRAKKLQVCLCRATLPVAVPVPPLRPAPSALLLHSSAGQARCSCAGDSRPRAAAAQRRRSSCCDDSTAPSPVVSLSSRPAREAHARRTPSWRTRSWRLIWTSCRRRCARCVRDGVPEAAGV